MKRLGGHPLSNGFDRGMICRRIKAVFPKALILICICEQGAILLSNYMQYLRNGGWNTPEAFITQRPDGRQPTLSLKFWEYHTLISMYYDAFGRGPYWPCPMNYLRPNPSHLPSEFATLPGYRRRKICQSRRLSM